MKEVGIRELKQRASEVIRQVRDGKDAVIITYRGRAVAKIVPMVDLEESRVETSAVWSEMDQLASEIATLWPPDTSVVHAVQEQRREL